MKSARSQTDLRIAEQAARWLIEIEEGGPEVLTDFAAWLKVSPVHVDEFLMATSVWSAFDGMDGAKRIDLERLLADARSGQQSSPLHVDFAGSRSEWVPQEQPLREDDGGASWKSVPQERPLRVDDAGASSKSVSQERPLRADDAGAGSEPGSQGPLLRATVAGPNAEPEALAQADVGDASSRATPRGFKPTRVRKGLFGLSFAAAVLLVCATVWLTNDSARTFATTTGEQRAFKLEDGSIVHLNTQSRVTLDFTPTTRTVHLVEGEALFTVERDPNRPFRVEAGGAVVQAIGTQFNVYRRADTTTISVVEGVVQILPRDTEARLAAGEQADVANDGRIDKHKVGDLEQVTAWRQRRLVFRGDSLEDVSREFNRYNRLHIEIDSPEIRTKRLTGVFNADDPESLVLFLKGDPELEIETSEDAVRIRRR